jgi:pyrroline-5-carboxylate reductase
MSVKGQKVGFVGSGNMGEALIRGLVAANVVPAEAVWASDVRGERLAELGVKYGIRQANDNSELVRQVDVVILAVKPQIMAAVLREIAPALTRRKLVISLAAGVSTARIRSALGREVRLIRVMPNTPALVLEGVTAIARSEGSSPAIWRWPRSSSGRWGGWWCSTRSTSTRSPACPAPGPRTWPS